MKATRNTGNDIYTLPISYNVLQTAMYNQNFSIEVMPSIIAEASQKNIYLSDTPKQVIVLAMRIYTHAYS